MTARPGFDFRQPLARQTSLLFDWRVDYVFRSPFSLDSLRQVATFARGSTSTGTDTAGATYNVANDQPRFTRWLNPVTSLYEPVLNLTAAAGDLLTYAYLGRQQAISIYVDLIWAAAGAIVSIGADTGQTPRVMIYDNIGIKPHFHNGTSSVEGGTPAGTLVVGERVEMLLTLAATGVTQLTWLRQGQSVPDVGTASGTLALTNGAAYGTEKISVRRYNGATGEGTLGLRQLKVAEGVQTFAGMQTLF